MTALHAQDAAFAGQLQSILHEVTRALGLCDRGCISGHEVTVAQSYSLLALPAPGAMSMNELRAAVSTAGSSTTRVVDQLVDKKLVRRGPDGEDRRIVRVALTERGRAVRDAICRDLETIFVRVAELVEQRDRESLLRGLRAVSAAMWEMLAGRLRYEEALEEQPGADAETNQEVTTHTDDHVDPAGDRKPPRRAQDPPFF